MIESPHEKSKRKPDAAVLLVDLGHNVCSAAIRDEFSGAPVLPVGAHAAGLPGAAAGGAGTPQTAGRAVPHALAAGGAVLRLEGRADGIFYMEDGGEGIGDPSAGGLWTIDEIKTVFRLPGSMTGPPTLSA